MLTVVLIFTYSFLLSEKNNQFDTDKFVVQEEISIGDWCIFVEKQKDIQNSLIIGIVLGFTYLDGKTFKAREYSKRSATVHLDQDSISSSDLRDVGVLCSFFTFNDEGELVAELKDRHKFTHIKSYFGTIKPPNYSNKLLTIPKRLVEEIAIACAGLCGNLYKNYILSSEVSHLSNPQKLIRNRHWPRQQKL